MTEYKKQYQKDYYKKHRGPRVAAARARKLRARKVLEKYRLSKEERQAADSRRIENRPLTLLDKKIINEYARTGNKSAAVRKYRPDVKNPCVAGTHLLRRPAVQSALLQAQSKLGINENYLTRKLKEGLDAKETKFFAHEGIVTDSRDIIDYNTRHRYLETAHKLRGDLTDAGKDSGAVIINITEIPGAKPADIIEGN